MLAKTKAEFLLFICALTLLLLFLILLDAQDECRADKTLVFKKE